MATPISNSAIPAVVLDATVAISLASMESATFARANAEVARYLALGYEFYAPGVLVSETLFILCRMKENDKTLSAVEHQQAVADFRTLLRFVAPPPQGEISLILRAEAIRGDYTCYRSADSLYIALAESLSETRRTVLLTLDAGLKAQAAGKAPTVTVELIAP